eukprot:CAMPEP_0174856780 /NCGR_PEP_ID=MMETSP1114-20130205/36215_1 /TAXON_ID=312471 /ORGANISM="Neobodo designis, Strain CCAP 1951/1" /LENGTH=370 /DNA_ID=CAMNT_0016091585 /DNA_START=54 /DNA_END=1166 /DNA_ORIENTATION=-
MPFGALLKEAGKVADKVSGKVDELTGKKKTRAGGCRDGTGHAISEAEFAEQTAKVIKGDVRMFSGCKDSQTSADVSNVASFGLPQVHGAEKAGGACTNALLSTLQNQRELISYGDLLIEMQRTLKQRRYTQVPQLSSSRKVDLKAEKFTVMNPNPSGRTRAVLIGINYYGQKGELSGCVNDVRQMKNFLVSQGFRDTPDCMQILTDDKSLQNAAPTAGNIIAALQWLVKDAQPGDSLFLHYSGHGGQLPDDNGDEEDGYDETLVPVDYATAGQIRDDTIFKIIVAPLRENVRLTCVMDCCHSGTILDLPYEFSANDGGVNELQSGGGAMAPNSAFSLAAAIAFVAEVVRDIFAPGAEVQKTIKFVSKALQ